MFFFFFQVNMTSSNNDLKVSLCDGHNDITERREPLSLKLRGYDIFIWPWIKSHSIFSVAFRDEELFRLTFMWAFKKLPILGFSVSRSEGSDPATDLCARQEWGGSGGAGTQQDGAEK